MKKQLDGLDYQGRHPEAAHPATEVGQDAAVAVVLVAVAFILAIALALLLPW